MSTKISKLIYNILPDWVGKKSLKFSILAYRKEALLREIEKLNILDSGREQVDGEELPFLRLADGTILFGQEPNEFERYLYSSNRAKLRCKVEGCSIGVAVDSVLRYIYPHAMPGLTPPYSLRKRKGFHPQHTETIDDIPYISQQEKQEVKKIFSPRQGETFLDVGAYMGYGSLRMRREIGDTGNVIAIEADPLAARIFKHNINKNKANNIKLIERAIWKNSNELLTFYKSDRQANSLIHGVIEPKHNAQVQTISIDNVLDQVNQGIVDAISMTVNGAEVEALAGMKNTFQRNKHMRLSIAGWYKRGDKKICNIVSPTLKEKGFNVLIGKKGGVIAWR